jgi:serine/threonine-protein kinase RsbW
VERQAFSKEFIFPGDSDSMVAARGAVMDFLHKHCSCEQVEIDILIALQEALANAVLHGCKSDAGKTIRCSVSVDPSAITIAISDPGPGFDVDAAIVPSGPNLTGHGRGISLMRGLMDEVIYRRGGSEVEMKKFRVHPD